MRLHRFFVGYIVGGQIDGQKKLVISDESLIHQWQKVFRLKSGDNVILFDGSGREWTCKIEMISKDGTEVSVGESRALNSPKKDVWLCVALIKKDHFEWVVEKGTELGVNHFVPVIAERSEKKDLNMERLGKIAKEASEQSGRGTIPKIHPVMTLQDVFAYDTPTHRIAFDLEGTAFISGDVKDDRPVAIFIGPEGGWSEKEIELFKKEEVDLKTLGEQVLRAETAAIATATLFLLG